MSLGAHDILGCSVCPSCFVIPPPDPPSPAAGQSKVDHLFLCRIGFCPVDTTNLSQREEGLWA